MSLKRKRSSSELCSSPISSVSSTYSSPPSRGNMAIDLFVPCPLLSNPSHLHSRTMKRYRDNRPSETEIHQRTLEMLYSAAQQQQQQHLDQPASDEAVPESPAEMTAQQSQATDNQQSLHRFWNINSQPTAQAFATAEPGQGVCQQAGVAVGGAQAGFIQSTLDQTHFVRQI